MAVQIDLLLLAELVHAKLKVKWIHNSRLRVVSFSSVFIKLICLTLAGQLLGAR